MKNYYVLICLLALGVAMPAVAQQDPQFSQYLFNQLYLSPAAVANDGMIRFQVMHRGQWAGYQGTFDPGGSLSTQLFSFQMPLNTIRSAVGFYATNETLGPQTNQELQLSYAFRVPLKTGQLSLGVRGGLYNKSIDFDRLRSRDPGDPIIGTGKVNEMQPDLAVGAYYSGSAFFAGASLNHLLGSKYKFGLENATNPLVASTYVFGGYRYYVTEEVELTPNALLKSDFTTFSVEAGVLATIMGRYWGGLSWRQGDALIGQVGANFGKNNAFRAGFSYDFVYGGQAAKAPSSYELLLSYALPAPKVARKAIVRTPRFRY